MLYKRLLTSLAYEIPLYMTIVGIAIELILLKLEHPKIVPHVSLGLSPCVCTWEHSKLSILISHMVDCILEIVCYKLATLVLMASTS